LLGWTNFEPRVSQKHGATASKLVVQANAAPVRCAGLTFS
jgi:hypothetical protein